MILIRSCTFVFMERVINKTIAFVKNELANAEKGHDWWHIERVYKNALYINQFEKANESIVVLAALLHDIADSKFHQGDESIGPRKAKEFMDSIQIPVEISHQVVLIIENMSFKNSFDERNYTSKELEVVQDADRLDAIGAIGIARAFTFGGFKNREIYNPEIPPVQFTNKEDYKNTTAPTINHFYEKLLLLKDKMNTETGKRLASERHEFMEMYLKQFYKEWNMEIK